MKAINENSIDLKYKYTLEYLASATREDLKNVFGFDSWDAVFSAYPASEIVLMLDDDARRRVRELAEDIGLDKMYSIVKELKGESN